MTEVLRNHEAPHPKLDWVNSSALPTLPYIEATGNPEPIFEILSDHGLDADIRMSPTPEILRPNVHITDISNVGINYELVAADARFQAGDDFRSIIRMGGAFDFYKLGRTVREVESYAVETMGLDASLYFHGAEQARRMNRLFVMQQQLHQNLFSSVVARYGHTPDGVNTLIRINQMVPSFKPRDVKTGITTGLIHDYGEVKLGRDIPFELKTDPAYSGIEAGACVQFATDLHFPVSASHLVDALSRRLDSESRDINFHDPEHDEASLYLDPVEITNSIFGTEQLHDALNRGEAFGAVERMEYVLSGIRAFEAVEHNFQGVRNDPILTKNLLRLGVSTFFNSLEALMGYAEKYVMIYDFVRQNAEQIGYYMDIVTTDAQNRNMGLLGEHEGVFGCDPFVNYAQSEKSERISRKQAWQNFNSTVVEWEKWRQKPHFIKTCWETYFGTEHPSTTDIPDVSFLHETARHISGPAGVPVAVMKPLRDMWGVGLDEASQQAQQDRLLQRAA